MKNIIKAGAIFLIAFSIIQADTRLDQIEQELRFIKMKQQQMISQAIDEKATFKHIFRKYHSDEVRALRGWLHLINETDHNTRYFLSNSDTWIKYVILPRLKFEMRSDEFSYVTKMVNTALESQANQPDKLIMKRYKTTSDLNLRRVPLLLDIVKKEVFPRGTTLDIEYSLYHDDGEWGYIVSKRGWVNMRYLREVR